MATGKTTVGKILAQKMNYGFVDTDEVIENETGMKITQIFKEKGEEYFRKIEKETVQKVSKQDKNVIACGGGAVLDPLNVKSLKTKGELVLLEASIEEIISRTKNDTSRPLLWGKDSREKAIKLLESRNQTYHEVADLVIDTTGKDPENISKEILTKLGISNEHKNSKE
jgi:shikimate kinase